MEDYMKIFKYLEFTFGCSLFPVDQNIIKLIINEENIAELTIEKQTCEKNDIKKYTYNLTAHQVWAIEDFAFKQKRMLRFVTDMAFPAIVKITKGGKKYIVEYFPEDLKGILRGFIPSEILNDIYSY